MSDPAINVTVAVCTYGRPRLLEQTLRGLVRQEYPSSWYEIIVVDNNSPDDSTRTVVESFAGAQVAPQYVREPRQGLSHARNRAVMRSRGDVIVFADDDVIVEPHWLASLVAPFAADRDLRIAVVAGEVIPVFSEGFPPWSILLYQPLRFRPDAGPIDQMPMGANMAFRRTALLEVGLFDTEVGRIGQMLFAGDENRPVKRLRQRSAEVWFVPEARVFHQLPRCRTTLAHALRHGFDSARSRVLCRVAEQRAARRSCLAFLVTRFLANLAKAIACGLHGALCTLLLQPGSACPAFVRASRACGYLWQISVFAARRVGVALSAPLGELEPPVTQSLPIPEVSSVEPE
ncbi:hypothetical protein DB347_21120 [Opitutaceae bacterium EW11]|nr:hypothetical protein DB347_21120 [Opitutaceae bacterium EW11]